MPVIIEHLADLDVLLVLSDQGIASVDPRIPRGRPGCSGRWIRSPRCGRSPHCPPGTPVAGPEIAAWWRRDGAVLTAALQVGVAAWTTELAVEYAKQRRQFGRPIGGFQAVKHLCADMAGAGRGGPLRRPRRRRHRRPARRGRRRRGRRRGQAAGRRGGHHQRTSCIQVHGGMGFTWEVPAHLAYKRARVLATQFGTADELAESWPSRLAESLADGRADGVGRIAGRRAVA